MSMSDKEITEIIATRVMGWSAVYHEGDVHHYCDGDPGGKYRTIRDFSPLTSDADCMMAWDRFAEGHTARIERVTGGWVCTGSPIIANITHTSGNADRRRAMCECMVKAVAS